MSTKPPHVPPPRPIGDIRNRSLPTTKKAPSFEPLKKIKAVVQGLVSTPSKAKRLAIIVIVIAVSLFIYNYVQTKNELNRLANPTAVSEREAEALAKEIGKFLELPDEKPSVATVKNASQLVDQSFFAQTKNGDKVLIYPDAGKAVLYRPSTKKVIEFAPVRLQDTDSVQQ